VLILHGLFGMGSNLGGIARVLAEAYEVHQLDLPNHGRSEWAAEMSLPLLASAVSAYIDGLGVDRVHVLGHSLGGKVAMQLAMDFPHRVERLVVADIAPVAYEPSHDAVFAAIGAVAAGRPQSRAEAAELLRAHLREEAVVQFLLLSLRRDSAGYYLWRFNAEGLRRDYARILQAPQGSGFGGPVLMIHGAESSYVTAAGKEAARAFFPELQCEAIAGTGHWLHVEKPAEFNAAVWRFLASAAGGAAEASA
jgi:esterase